MAAEWHFDNGTSREIITGPSTIAAARDELERHGFARNLPLLQASALPRMVPDPGLHSRLCGLERFNAEGAEDPAGNYVHLDDVLRLLLHEGFIPPLGG